jgi:hypothetical protein
MGPRMEKGQDLETAKEITLNFTEDRIVRQESVI